MNLFDIILLSILLGSIFLGTYRGLLVTSIGIGSFFLTIIFTSILFPLAEEIVKEHIESAAIVNSISIIVAYILSSFASHWISGRLKEVISPFTKGMIDRLLGFWIGALRGYLVCFTCFLIICIVSSWSFVGAKNVWQVYNNINEESYPKWLKKGYLFPVLNKSSLYLHHALEGSFIESYFTNIELPASKEYDADNNSKDTSGAQDKNSNHENSSQGSSNERNSPPDNHSQGSKPINDQVLESIQKELVNEAVNDLMKKN
jgi:uncharacterized membrane protein required for colicin V production